MTRNLLGTLAFILGGFALPVRTPHPPAPGSSQLAACGHDSTRAAQYQSRLTYYLTVMARDSASQARTKQARFVVRVTLEATCARAIRAYNAGFPSTSLGRLKEVYVFLVGRKQYVILNEDILEFYSMSWKRLFAVRDID